VYIRTSPKRIIFAATKGGVSDYQESIHSSAWNRNSRKTATPSNAQLTPKIVYIGDVPTLASPLPCHHGGQQKRLHPQD
jgi:hypothetical protein